MFELIKAGGWLMLPILACSVVALAIILERLWALRRARVLPEPLVKALHSAARNGRIADSGFGKRALESPLGRIVLAGWNNRTRGREFVKERIEDTGRQVVHELERFLNALGTIAAIAPLLGLLGTVFGMIEVFNVISTEGSGNAELLAGGISTALITTAAGLTVAIPSLLFYRYFRARVDTLVLLMEQEAIHLIELVDGAPAGETLS